MTRTGPTTLIAPHGSLDQSEVLVGAESTQKQINCCTGVTFTNSYEASRASVHE